MILNDSLIHRVVRWKRSGEYIISIRVKKEDLGDLANRLVLESWADEDVPVQIIINEIQQPHEENYPN